MASSFGGTVKLKGESEYRKALSQISAQLGVVSSEMTKVTAEFGKNDRSTDGLAKKNGVLSSKLETQKQKVELLKSALAESKEMYGETDKRTLKWQQSLNKAEADVIKTTKEIDSLGKEVSEAGKNAEKSGDGFTIFKGIVANLGSQAITSALNGLKNLGGAFINLGKQSVSNYAILEQNVGGIETLFKKSADTVIANSKRAYKTAGMDANTYMETVTSFSASLLQSLDGNTKKAAKAADQAVVDMADNSNKMGTSMEMIQNAYQGFAKQNYTMLDNLKLGYGGTKGEMERLLKDAGKLSGQKYDISSLNDVYQAIHVVQKEMGITGTTAKEASETISGSFTSAKSAFANFLSGTGDVKSVVDTFTTLGTNVSKVLVKIVPQLVNGLVQIVDALIPEIVPLFQKLLPVVLDGLSTLFEGLIQALPSVINILIGIFPKIITFITIMLPKILQALVTGSIMIVNALATQLPAMIPQIIDAILLMIPVLIDNLPLFIEAGINLVIGLLSGLVQATPTLLSYIPEITVSILKALVKLPILLAKAGVNSVLSLANAVVNNIFRVVSAVKNLGTKVIGKVKEILAPGELKNIGKNLVEGLWNGIKNAKDWVLNKIKGFGENLLKGIKNVFGIHSPSTVFRDEVGVNLAKGIGIGFESEIGNINKMIKASLPTDFDINPNVKANLTDQSKFSQQPINIDRDKKIGDFNLTINNNSKFTSPAENARLLRKEYELYKLKYGGV